MEQNKKEPSGVLLIDKHKGVTSHDIVAMVRKAYNTKRVGHTGTLDPMATGLLVVLVGRAAKASEFLVADKKHYSATMRLGMTTDTEDISGKILTVSDFIPSAAQVEKACCKFRGKISQIPPMYSAIKIGGRKLVDIARQGGEIERKPRNIEIFSLTCTPSYTPSDYNLDVVCSAGTYIRTLCADIGRELGCGAVMAELRRTEAGTFGTNSTVTTAQLETMTEKQKLDFLLPVESLFSSLEAIDLPPFYEKLCRSGCEIYQKKLHTDIPCGAYVRLRDAGGHFFALGITGNYPEGTAVKSVKLFEL